MGRSRAHVAAIIVVAASLAAPLCAESSSPLTAIVMERFDRLRLDVEESADVMPAEKYSFRLTDGQRTFGEWIAHIATGNYGYCSSMRGERPPEKAKQIQAMKTKADLAAAVKESFAYCAESLKGMNDQKALVPIGPAGVPPVRGMVNMVSSGNEHYGNIVGYMRANNIVPPSTVRAQQQQKKSATR